MGRAYALKRMVYVGTSRMLAVRAREVLLLPKALLPSHVPFQIEQYTSQGH